ncbi:MAG: ABC-type amino acid transport substrate-binding protein [bacterium]|jgi:ABC-type amino acid transport substrate-binding protein
MQNTKNYPTFYFILGVTISFIYLFTSQVFAKDSVIYPRPKSIQDTRYNDTIELLQTALKKTVPSDGAFVFRLSKYVMNHKRAFKSLRSGRITVIIASPKKRLEKEFIPIRIPIRKGILGYRIFLIRKQDQEKFARIRNIKELKQLIVGQGSTWADLQVFKKNKFGYMAAANYEGLFKMLIRKRFDYFSRGVNEAYPEYYARKKKLPDLWVESTILLYYPWPKYFFLAKKNKKLADRIRRGLEIMIKDGSYDQIFWKYHKKSIQRANLKNRRIFRIKNPLLPKTAPLHRKSLWYRPI